ncbi:MAG: hypothetical protein ABL921_23565 [Pirellula sp.]
MRWILRDDNAQFATNSWAINTTLGGEGPHVHLRSRNTPELQLDMVVRPKSDAIDAELSQAGLDKLTLRDAYVRLNDLIASYPETAPWRFGFQIDIRVVDPHESQCACIETWLSVQTSLLDSHPKLLVSLGHPKFTQHECGLWVSSDDCFGLAVHTLDQSDCVVAPDGDRLTMTVFGRFMEKGVIRRMRFRIFASAHPQKASFWKQQLREFSESPLPLTT